MAPIDARPTLATLAVPMVLAYFAFRGVAIGLVALGVLGAWTLIRLLLALFATHTAGLLLLGALVRPFAPRSGSGARLPQSG